MSDSIEIFETSFIGRYQFDRVQRWLHWTMAFLIFAAIGLGVVSAYLPVGQQPRRGLLDVHKSIGFTLVTLLLVRISWRCFTGEPAYRHALDRLTRIAAKLGHLALYALMLFMPITGYMYSAAGNYSLPWFGLFQWPRVLPHDDTIADWGKLLHDRGAWAISAIILVHLAAVAFHHWVKRDEVLSRMTGR